MTTSRDLLELVAEYVEARQNEGVAESMGGVPISDPEEIAARWDASLAEYISAAR